MGKKTRIGIVGCGTIGAALTKACLERFSEKSDLVGLSDLDEKKIEKLSKELSKDIASLTIDELIEKSDLIVEAASPEVVPELARKIIDQDKSFMAMSVGGFIGSEDLLKAAESRGVKIFLPSGALCGLDAVKSAGSTIESATLITRKPPKALSGAPYIVKKGIDLESIKKETIIFEGSAKEATKGFPKNINVSAALSLAGIGSERTRVKIIASPEFKGNSHEIIIEGDFGELRAKTDNRPSPTNPKTSFLAVLSAIATLESILKSVRVGT